MQTNALPAYDASDNPSGCCPRFNPEGWDNRDLHFENKLFVRATSKSDNYVPVDWGPVFERTFAEIEKAGAYDETDIIILTRDVSPSEAEHFFAVSKAVPDQEMVRWSGDYRTRVFEGPYESVPNWQKAFTDDLAGDGLEAGRMYSFYTTCPKCFEVYGKNYVVEVAELAASPQPVETASA